MKGLKYVTMGVGLLLVPGASVLSYLLAGWLPRSRAVGLIAVVGLFGGWLLFKGIGLLVSPKSQSGDASEETDPDSLFD